MSAPKVNSRRPDGSTRPSAARTEPLNVYSSSAKTRACAGNYERADDQFEKAQREFEAVGDRLGAAECVRSINDESLPVPPAVGGDRG